jgi:hypothetical protein
MDPALQNFLDCTEQLIESIIKLQLAPEEHKDHQSRVVASARSNYEFALRQVLARRSSGASSTMPKVVPPEDGK